MKYLFDYFFVFPRCLLIPILIIMLCSAIEYCIHKKITKLFFLNFLLCIFLVITDILQKVSIFQYESMVGAMRTFFLNDSVIYLYIVWLPVVFESLILNVVILSAKLYIGRTNNKK